MVDDSEDDPMSSVIKRHDLIVKLDNTRLSIYYVRIRTVYLYHLLLYARYIVHNYILYSAILFTVQCCT